MAIDIGPKIGMDGEAEFRKQLNNINTTERGAFKINQGYLLPPLSRLW